MANKKCPYDIDLQTVKRECIREGCTKIVTSSVWPGGDAPKKFCPDCKCKVVRKDYIAEEL
jgi:hypothetical protein